MSWPMNLRAHFEIRPAASRLRMTSPSGYEVMTKELLGCHKNGIQKLLNKGVANFGVSEYLTDEVHRSLDLQGVSRLLPIDDEGGAHNVVACRDVGEEGLSLFGSNKDWGRRQ